MNITTSSPAAISHYMTSSLPTQHDRTSSSDEEVVLAATVIPNHSPSSPSLDANSMGGLELTNMPSASPLLGPSVTPSTSATARGSDPSPQPSPVLAPMSTPDSSPDLVPASPSVNGNGVGYVASSSIVPLNSPTSSTSATNPLSSASSPLSVTIDMVALPPPSEALSSSSSTTVRRTTVSVPHASLSSSSHGTSSDGTAGTAAMENTTIDVPLPPVATVASRTPSPAWVKILIVAAYFGTQTGSPLALTYSKHGNDSYAFSSLHILVFAYILVASVATFMHVRMYGRRSLQVLSKKRALELLPVAFFDGGVEVFRITALGVISAGTFVILANLRLILTSLFNRIFLKRKLSQFQLAALVFVLCGILISNSTNLEALTGGNSFALGLIYSLLYGIFGGCVDCYMDYILKKQSGEAAVHLFTQIMQTATYGIIGMYFVTLATDSPYDRTHYTNGWDGRTVLVYILVTSNVPTAYLVMKYVDSMAKAMIQAIAVIAVVLLTIAFFGASGSLFPVLVGAVVTTLAVLQFKIFRAGPLY